MKPLAVALWAGLVVASGVSAAEVKPLAAGLETNAPIVVRFESRGKQAIDGVYEQIAAYAATSLSIERVELASSPDGKRRDLGVYPRAGSGQEVLDRLTAMTPTRTRLGRNRIIDRRSRTVSGSG